VLWCRSSKDNLTVLGQLIPLTLVKGDKLRTAEHNGLSRSISVIVKFQSADGWVDGHCTVQSLHGVYVLAGDDTTLFSDSPSSQGKVTGNLSLISSASFLLMPSTCHKDSDTSSTERVNNIRDFRAWRVHDADQTNKGQTSQSLVVHFRLKGRFRHAWRKDGA